MSDSEMAFELAEAIRLTLIFAHYPETRTDGYTGPVCTCAHDLTNRCNRLRLEEAFRKYAKANPQRFPVL